MIKQIGQRYRVRQDPYFHGFWCIVDREVLRLHVKYLTSGFDWPSLRVEIRHCVMHFRDPGDALKMVELLEISDKCNGEG